MVTSRETIFNPLLHVILKNMAGISLKFTWVFARLALVLKTIFHQCFISYTFS